MKIALAQINPTVGDIKGNVRKILEQLAKAKSLGVELLVFPELVITGYPPEDLVLKPQFVNDNLLGLKEIIKHCAGLAVYLGFVNRKGKILYNAGAFVVDRKIKEIYHKMHLPNYAVFDEKRYFAEGKKVSVVNYQGIKIGLGICEDIWVERGPYLDEVRKGAKLLLNINASPYYRGRIFEREKMLKGRARQTKAYIAYVNMVGGQDELIFDGGSMVFNPQGKLMASAKQFQEELLVFDLKRGGAVNAWLDELSEIYQALLLGVKDYVEKNNFKEVVVGVSGGIDSALTLTIAADALGKERVHALFMPSAYSSEQSFEDAKKLCENLGIDLRVISINELFSFCLSLLKPHFEGKPPDITEENLQARLRGLLLMAFSNKFGWLVLTTGNKSETSTGYCTLYGDMAGGFNVLKDVPKTLVYRLANWRNQKNPVIPESIIKRPPTAELKPDQKDQDTLPPYEILDPIMKAYVEENKSVKQITALGFDAEVVKKVVAMIDSSEYKRRQAPPGPRISPRAFGKDWRLPITNRYREI